MTMGKIKRDPRAVAIAQKIIEEYDPSNVQDMNDTIKDILGRIFEDYLKAN